VPFPNGQFGYSRYPDRRMRGTRHTALPLFITSMGKWLLVQRSNPPGELPHLTGIRRFGPLDERTHHAADILPVLEVFRAQSFSHFQMYEDRRVIAAAVIALGNSVEEAGLTDLLLFPWVAPLTSRRPS